MEDIIEETIKQLLVFDEENRNKAIADAIQKELDNKL
jgi:hypothetical protein